MAVTAKYLELSLKYQEEYGKKTILLMQIGSFFEVYSLYDKENNVIYSSALEEFSNICELNIVEKLINNKNIVMAGFKDYMIEKYLKKLQDAGYTTVVYTQDDNVSNVSEPTRSLFGIFSPGTYFQTESNTMSNTITCIWVDFIENKIVLKGKYVVVGVANIDIYTGKTTIFQFKEIYINNPTTYDQLERFISINNPSEVILISNLPDEREIDSIITYAGISCGKIHKIHINDKLNDIKLSRIKNCEKQHYQKEVLSRFYKRDNYDNFIEPFYENNIASQSFCYLLDFVYQHNPQLVHNITEPVFETCSTRITLSNHTLKQLNIINDGNVKASKLSCVSEMLNNCLTQMGKRSFLYNFLNPTCDENKLNREYNIIDFFLNKNDDIFNQQLKIKLTNIKDLSKFERQIFLKKISPKSLHSLKTSIAFTSEIFNMIKNEQPIIKYFENCNININEIGNLCIEIICFLNEHCDFELAKDIDQLTNFDINFIKKGVDNELDEKTEKLNECSLKLEAIRGYLSGLIDKNENKCEKQIEYVKLHETEKNSYGLILTNRRCKYLYDALPKVDTILKLTTTENTVFDFKISNTRITFEKQSSNNNFIVDEQINSICKNMTSIKLSYQKLIMDNYNRIVEKFGKKYHIELQQIIQFITLIDVIYTKSDIAKKYNYCKPEIVHSEKSFVETMGLRHCLSEQLQMNELYVSNDISIGNKTPDGILLYGTNAVGKTTLIKALGICVIMAQAGLYTPCSSFKFKPYKKIFTRIIGNDNIFKGLSTFEVEMLELRTILRLTDENSLILGDELCSGTETVSAISIFVAGIQHLHKSKSSFIFATHLHEITNYEEIVKLNNVALMHMEVKYDKEHNKLVYDRKLKNGSGNNIYGLEVCKSLDLPAKFLEAANDIRIKYNPGCNSILSLKQSRYNSKKIIGVCEMCGTNMGTEVHHLQYQKNANNNGIISTPENSFHKNTLANLMTICEKCHIEQHKKNINGEKRVKTITW